MPAKSLMFQGTGSDVGKSLVVAGLCRLFARQGMKVVPFKAQNMSNNAAVTNEGGEIGRAQWLQALAAGVDPSVHMNPVLLKPQSDRTSQVVVRGKVAAAMGAQEYQAYRATLLPTVLESYHHLAKNADLVLVEGAGSPAEINLRGGDIANMGFARAANCPVILIGDIDRGGVIASVVGTHAVLPEADRGMIRGFLINKFRGDPTLFASGAKEIETRTSWRDLGLIPHHPPLADLPAEDSLALTHPQHATTGRVHVVILTTPQLANFDDLDPLTHESDIRLTWLKAGEVIPADASLVILAGSKSTIADLAFIRAQGWDIDVIAHHRRGGRVLGICGGYQMLGKTLADPEGFDGTPATVSGLGLLDTTTLFTGNKIVTPWHGQYEKFPVEGYEIHSGVSTGGDCSRPFFTGDGACSADGRVFGTYIHGLFTNDEFRAAFLTQLGAAPLAYHYHDHINTILNGWADVLEREVASDVLLSLAMPIAG